MEKIEITPALVADLKTKAETATRCEWKANAVDYGSLVCINPDSIEDMELIIEPIEKAGGEYIAAANPAVVLALIERLERLERDADWLAEKLEDGDIYNFYRGYLPVGKIRDKSAWRKAARKAVAGE